VPAIYSSECQDPGTVRLRQSSTRSSTRTTFGEDGTVRRLAAVGVVAANVVAAVALVLWLGHRSAGPGAPTGALAPPSAATVWDGLGPQARCDSAVALVTQPDPWPTICRWREATDALQGQSFPPPKGAAPYDDPHIEVYIHQGQSRYDVAHAIAHELGHMRHTREPDFVPAWLAARNLSPDTPSAIWTEDYAETFAALFGPPSDQWRAPTPRPGAEALAALRTRFFS